MYLSLFLFAVVLVSAPLSPSLFRLLMPCGGTPLINGVVFLASFHY
jgi:hypothetical protein